MKRICGLDVSTSTIGFSIIETTDDYNLPKLVYLTYIKPSKKGSIFERIAKAQVDVNSLLVKYKPDLISIEDIVQFMAGGSGAKTIIGLARMNISIGMIAFKFLNRPPSMFNVMSIRHGIKLDKALPKKEDIPELVSKLLGITFPYVYDKKGNRAPESEDMADAVAVALFATKRIKQIEELLNKPSNARASNQVLLKKRQKQLDKQRKELQAEYKEITGDEYKRSV